MSFQHAIRIAYYTRVNDLNKLQNPMLRNYYLEDIMQYHGGHVDHCFEYLRHALMCSADSNLEDLDETGEASGWGVKRTCRNYEDVKNWSEKWKNSAHKGIL